MTSLPAKVFGIQDRGTLTAGNWADMVVLDLDKLTSATYEHPKSYPYGIAYVMVNGRWVIKSSQFTGTLPGETLRHVG